RLLQTSSAAQTEQVGPGIWKFSFGRPESITPVKTRHYQPSPSPSLPPVPSCPVTVTGRPSRGGYLVTLPLEPDEMVYGLGLQFMSFAQRGLKKLLRVNADPKMDTGDSHAPVPFYVTTRGYGVLIDTARYATIYLGNKVRLATGDETPAAGDTTGAPVSGANRRNVAAKPSEVLAEVPRASGIDV